MRSPRQAEASDSCATAQMYARRSPQNVMYNQSGKPFLVSCFWLCLSACGKYTRAQKHKNRWTVPHLCPPPICTRQPLPSAHWLDSGRDSGHSCVVPWAHGSCAHRSAESVDACWLLLVALLARARCAVPPAWPPLQTETVLAGFRADV
jgi:hypothetical protein